MTRHNSHAKYTAQALRAGKHVFVEKPLALDFEELKQIQDSYEQGCSHLMVGFNRRFAPQIQTMKKLLELVKAPKNFIMVMNAGAIPANHWTQDPKVGGGRIIGEACHYIDLMRFLAGAPICSIQARSMGQTNAEEIIEDKASITLGFEDGSFGTIHYFANGGASFPKERIEVFSSGSILQLHNFLKLRGYNWPAFNKQNLLRQDKGQNACAQAFINTVEGKIEAPISAEEIFEVARVSIEVAKQLRIQT